MPVNLYSPQTMMRAIERMAPVNTFFKSTFFKTEVTFPTETVQADFTKGNRRIAPFVHPKIGGKAEKQVSRVFRVPKNRITLQNLTLVV